MKKLLIALVFAVCVCKAQNITAVLTEPIQLNPVCTMLGPMCPPVPDSWDPLWLLQVLTDAGPDVVAFELTVTFSDNSNRVVIVRRSEVPFGMNTDGSPLMQTVKQLRLGTVPYASFSVHALTKALGSGFTSSRVSK